MNKIKQWSLVAASCVLAMGGGIGSYLLKNNSTFELENTTLDLASGSSQNAQAQSSDPTLPAQPLPSSQSQPSLKNSSPLKNSSLSSPRDRYTDAVSQLRNNPRAAIAALAGLETTYPLLAEYVLLKRAQAFTLAGDRTQAAATYSQVVQQFSQSAVAAEALFALGQTPALLQRFPSHPRSLNVILTELKKTPDRQGLLVLAAVYFNDRKEVLPLLDRLTVKYAPQLTPAQWWAIAEGYFNQRAFEKAANAYARATPNSFTAYRIGRSWQRASKRPQALIAYLRMAQQYANAAEAPRALLRAIEASEPSGGVRLADRVIATYPNFAAEALLSKYDLTLRLSSGNVANAASRTLTSQYPGSEATATLLWRLAQQQAKAGNTREALRLASSLRSDLPHSEIEAEAHYWAGKWANKLGDRPTAQRFFQSVIKENAASYFAWRSAVQLGWQVGDFNNVRSLNFALQTPTQRQPLPAGSALVQELYLLGQDRDAATQWQFETRGKLPLNLKETFTDGVMRVAANDNIIGIYQLDSLNWLDVSVAEKAEIERLKQHPAYFQNLYPFAYGEAITKWSKANSINPALVTGLIRQESRFEAEILSVVGATGLMQIMPETGAWIASKKGRANYSLRDPENNIEFGVYYLDYTHSRFNNNSMLAVASYNAGPNAVAGWATSGIGDPDEFVERIPYAETRGYVKHVFENYWNYLRLYSPTLQAQLQTLTSKR